MTPNPCSHKMCRRYFIPRGQNLCTATRIVLLGIELKLSRGRSAIIANSATSRCDEDTREAEASSSIGDRCVVKSNREGPSRLGGPEKKGQKMSRGPKRSHARSGPYHPNKPPSASIGILRVPNSSNFLPETMFMVVVINGSPRWNEMHVRHSSIRSHAMSLYSVTNFALLT